MTNVKMNLQTDEARRMVLALVSSALFSNEFAPSETIDWKKVYKECKMQSIDALVYNVAKPYLPQDLSKEWGKNFRQTIASNVFVDAQHGEVHRIMTSQNIPYVTMKGSSSAAYYPVPMLRNMGDVDFLVHKEDIEKAGKALESIGFYEKYDTEEQFHIAYKSEHSTWEMHWEPNGIPNGPKGDIIREYMNDVIDTSKLHYSDEFCFRIPDTFHHGMILLLHTSKHMMNTGVGLRHICDWATFAASINDDEFKSIFEEKLKNAGMWRFAQFLTLISVKFLGCPEKKWAGNADDELLEAMINDVFNGGNFGVKDLQRVNEIKLMNDYNNGGLSGKNVFIQLFENINTKAKSALPVTKKIPVLLPVGWVYISYQLLFRVIKGERPSVKIGKAISGAKERKSIYSQFELFK